MESNADQLFQLLKIFLSWPSVVLFAIILLRIPLIRFLDYFSKASEIELTVGSLSIQAKAMREIHESIGLGFQEQTIRKAEVEALIDTKIRSIQSAIEFETTKSEVRNDPRKVKSQEIKIMNNNGEIFTGETLDISEAGIGFKSKGRLQFNEVVQITPTDNDFKFQNSDFDNLKIVRIEQADEGFYYGAKVSSNTQQFA